MKMQNYQICKGMFYFYYHEGLILLGLLVSVMSTCPNHVQKQMHVLFPIVSNSHS